MQMRLQKALAQAGVASRRKAEELIVDGRVEVNGERVTELGTQVDPDRDLIRVSGKLLEKEKKVYFVFFKPTGVVTTLSDPQGRPTVRDFLSAIPQRVFAVGRLDFDAEGALIVTNDGELANRLMHPRYEVPRVYLAKVKGTPDAETLAMLRSGVRLEDGVVHPAQVEVGAHAERNTWLKLVLTEGRPHLVKRLCAAIGHPVVRLYRPMYGGISAEGLAPGTFRPLSPAEVAMLQEGGDTTIPSVNQIKPPPRHHRAEGADFPEAAAAGRARAESERPSTARRGEGRGAPRSQEDRSERRPPSRRGEGAGERRFERSSSGAAGARRGEGRESPRSKEGRAERRPTARRGEGFGEKRFAGERASFGGAGARRGDRRPTGDRRPAGDRPADKGYEKDSRRPAGAGAFGRSGEGRTAAGRSGGRPGPRQPSSGRGGGQSGAARTGGPGTRRGAPSRKGRRG